MVATTGHSWAQVWNDWDVPRLIAWNRYCDECPPLNLMVQAYLGIKPVRRNKKDDAEALLATLAVFPGSVRKP